VKAEDLFHVGVVSADVGATVATLSAVLGYEWAGEVGGPIEVNLPTGDTVLDIRCTYSTSLPRLEVVRAIPGTLWEPAAGAGIHHLGYWSDDVAADAVELEEQGYVREAGRSLPDGSPFFTFHIHPSGFRIELLTRAAQPSLEGYFGQPAAATSGGSA
jgi:hypothetical protein